MKIFRISILIIFGIAFLAFCWCFIKDHHGVDETIPVINIPEGTLVVETDAEEKDFLAGVTAYDEKDGDLTDRLMIESVSKFSNVKKGICKVTYAVCDNDKHVTSASRKIQFKGYKSPIFTSNRSLCFSMYEKIDLTEAIGAKDCIEGDLSGNVIITSTDYESGVAGSFSIMLKLTTEKGDLIEEEIPLIVEDRPLNAPSIQLKEYIAYVDKNSAFNPKSYLKHAEDAMELDLTPNVTIDSNVKIGKKGVYTVNYYVSDSLDRTGHSMLIVIVK